MSDDTLAEYLLCRQLALTPSQLADLTPATIRLLAAILTDLPD